MATTEETILSHSQRGMHKIVPRDLGALKAATEYRPRPGTCLPRARARVIRYNAAL
ncbi:hypothetical protein [Hugonella massiliensis]|uniref:hypothetical protein n=1 Tax=Hugonella massiliensis TaxID=1720315 RepID=UPI0012E35BD9|nr:hypothetical protein [Hugonella massiliensis]